VGGLLTVGLVVRVLSPFGGDPSALIKVPKDTPVIREFVESKLGPVVLAPGLGHDGKFFFIQALDPFGIDVDQSVRLIDRPIYRMQRILYPLLAGGGGLFSAHAAMWGLVVVNVLAMMVGTWAAARIAVGLGTSPWLGLAFPLNPGMALEVIIDGAGALAWCLGMIGVMFLMRDRRALAAGALGAAVLTREVMLLTVLGVAVCAWRLNGRFPLRLIAAAATPAIVWGLVLRARYPSDPPTDRSTFARPFEGLVEATRFWLREPDLDLVVGVTILFVGFLVVRRLFLETTYLAWAAVGHLALLPLLSVFIWLKYFDLSRAAAPAITAALILGAPRKPPSDHPSLARTTLP
jgi:hypothetical protein